MMISSSSCPPIPSEPPRSSCSPCRGTQDMVRTRQMCEESLAAQRMEPSRKPEQDCQGEQALASRKLHDQ